MWRCSNDDLYWFIKDILNDIVSVCFPLWLQVSEESRDEYRQIAQFGALFCAKVLPVLSTSALHDHCKCKSEKKMFSS